MRRSAASAAAALRREQRATSAPRTWSTCSPRWATTPASTWTRCSSSRASCPRSSATTFPARSPRLARSPIYTAYRRQNDDLYACACCSPRRCSRKSREKEHHHRGRGKDALLLSAADDRGAARLIHGGGPFCRDPRLTWCGQGSAVHRKGHRLPGARLGGERRHGASTRRPG